MYEEDRALLNDIRSEGEYIEGLVKRYKTNEDKLLEIMHTAYNKLEVRELMY